MSGQEIWVIRKNHLLKRLDPSLVTTDPLSCVLLSIGCEALRSPTFRTRRDHYGPNQGYDSVWIVRNPE